MSAATNAQKATIRGGLLFLVPAVAFRLAKQAVGPLTRVFPEHTIIGVTTTSILAVAALVLACLLAGLFARTSIGTRLTNWFEESIFGGIPRYRVLKSVTVLVRADTGWQIGYVFDRLDGGWLSVFLPQAPTPLSGDLTFLPADQVKPIQLSLKGAMRLGQTHSDK